MSEMESKPKKPNILVRVLALLVTAALLIGAVFLVANRDKFNLDALKRWQSKRILVYAKKNRKSFTGKSEWADRKQIASWNERTGKRSDQGSRHYTAIKGNSSYKMGKQGYQQRFCSEWTKYADDHRRFR